MSNAYQEAADALGAEHAPPWKVSKPEEGHPHQIGGEVVRIGYFDKGDIRARTYTIRTAFQSPSAVQNDFWSIWAFAPAAGQTESRMTRLLNELELKVGDHVLCSFAGRKAFTDGSGKSWLDYSFVRIHPGEEPPPEPQYDADPNDDGGAGLPAEQPDFGEVPT